MHVLSTVATWAGVLLLDDVVHVRVNVAPGEVFAFRAHVEPLCDAAEPPTLRIGYAEVPTASHGTQLVLTPNASSDACEATVYTSLLARGGPYVLALYGGRLLHSARYFSGTPPTLSYVIDSRKFQRPAPSFLPGANDTTTQKRCAPAQVPARNAAAAQPSAAVRRASFLFSVPTNDQTSGVLPGNETVLPVWRGVASAAEAVDGPAVVRFAWEMSTTPNTTIKTPCAFVVCASWQRLATYPPAAGGASTCQPARPELDTGAARGVLDFDKAVTHGGCHYFAVFAVCGGDAEQRPSEGLSSVERIHPPDLTLEPPPETLSDGEGTLEWACEAAGGLQLDVELEVWPILPADDGGFVSSAESAGGVGFAAAPMAVYSNATSWGVQKRLRYAAPAALNGSAESRGSSASSLVVLSAPLDGVEAGAAIEVSLVVALVKTSNQETLPPDWTRLLAPELTRIVLSAGWMPAPLYSRPPTACRDGCVVLDHSDQPKVTFSTTPGNATITWPGCRMPPLRGQSLFAVVDARDVANPAWSVTLDLIVDITSCTEALCPSGRGECRPPSISAADLAGIIKCQCRYGFGGEGCALESLSPLCRYLEASVLVLSNLAVLPAVAAARAAGMAGAAAIFALSGLFSALYHTCDVELFCWGVNYKTLQDADFFYAFLAFATAALHCFAPLSSDLALPTHVAVGAPLLLAAIDGPTRSINLIFVGIVCAATIAASRASGGGRPTIQRRPLLVGVALGGFGFSTFVFQRLGAYWLWHSVWHVCAFASLYFFVQAALLESSAAAATVAVRARDVDTERGSQYARVSLEVEDGASIVKS